LLPKGISIVGAIYNVSTGALKQIEN